TKEIQDLLGQTFNSLRFSSGESRLLEVDQQLHMSTELALTIDGKPYEAAVVAGKIYNLSPLFLHATGQFNIYEGGNSLSQQLKEMIIDDMQEGGYLCSPQFTVNTDQEELTYSPDHHFKFDPSDKRFKESVAFANATQMMDWFLTMDKGAHWSGAQVELRLTEEPSKAGPMYANPKSSKTQKRPVIFLPDEMTSPFDTKPVLKNLATDFDVVAHELGHHIVGQYLSFANKPESIMVNEGLADFFVYAKTGSSCLAESICTAESHVCQIPGHCLRTADVVLDITDPKFAHLEVHFQSEVVSGMLWELGSSQLGLANTARLTMQAIRYLNKITDVSDLLTSLLQADRDLFEGQNNCAIQAVAKKRGIMNDSSNSVACK
ncbi:MAG: hypothetical protein NTX25_13480, partial [Proteobacteria bacterium]|nr:hypothetical protein [Pseudomonadota bacterium]